MNTTTITNAAEFRNLPLALLTESTTNPRRIFEDEPLKELAESIRSQGVLSPLLVRPLTERGFEIVAGARRYRAAQMAEAATVPVRIVHPYRCGGVRGAAFDKRDTQLVPAAGSCVDCPKRTGHNKLLFSDMGKLDACTDPNCYQAKVEAHVAKAVAAKPKLVQISTAHGLQQEGSPVLPRNKYVEIRTEKPSTKEEATRPEFKTCKHTTEAIVSDGIDKGELRKVCTDLNCPVHHPKKRPQQIADDGKWKAEQEKQRREAALANTVGIRTLAAITAAVPVRLMKRDLLFVVGRLAASLDENRLSIVARQHGIKKATDSDSIGKLFAAYLRRAEESALGGLLVEITILHAAMRQNPTEVLRDAAAPTKWTSMRSASR
jgi:ParB family chromosome partitioning protein